MSPLAWSGSCGDWQEAVTFLEMIERQGYQPTVVTFGAAITSCEKAKKWQHALEFFEIMSYFEFASGMDITRYPSFLFFKDSSSGLQCHLFELVSSRSVHKSKAMQIFN